MLKRISVEQLRLGMFVHELCGSWMDHPFWRSSIRLEDAQTLRQIQSSKVTQVIIDTAKGLDVEVEDVDESEEYDESEQDRAEEEDQDEQDELTQALAAAAPQVVYAPEPVKKVELEAEVGRAAKICAKARSAVSSMFQEARMGKALDAQYALPVVEEISSSISRNPGALIGLARLKNKDDYTYMHSVAVCGLMVALSRQLDLPDVQVRDAGMAGLLHDIGKMMIPSAVLNKPGKLTDEEFTLVKTHSAEGHKLLLAGSGVSEGTLDVCLHHHEQMSGHGYPDKLKGDEISLFAKMGAICDVYDAITSDRPYKRGWDPAEAIRKMAEWSGPHFDPVIFQAFVKSIGIYPVGTLVKLESGRLGVVMDQTDKSLLAPKVKVFYSTKALTHLTPQIIDLSAPGVQDKIVGREEADKWGLKNVNKLWLGDAIK